MQDELFFIAVLPPLEIQEEVTAFKEYAERHFRSSHALRSPPHVTLFPPFRWPASRREDLFGILAGFAREEAPFLLTLKDFACFRPRVIYVDILPSKELTGLHRRLSERLGRDLGLAQKDRRDDFHPHMTVAFKDLRPPMFNKAWVHFSRIPYERNFRVTALALLRHVDRRWQVAQEFPLSGS